MTESGFWWVESDDESGADAADFASLQAAAARRARRPAHCSQAGTLTLAASNGENPCVRFWLKIVLSPSRSARGLGIGANSAIFSPFDQLLLPLSPCASRVGW